VKINFISSLDSDVKSGGAHLRISAIKRIYELLGLEINNYYNNDPREIFSVRPYLSSLYYGNNSRILFKRKSLAVSSAPILHLDNLRQFMWRMPQEQKPFRIYNAHNLEFENFYGREDSLYKKRFEEYELKRIQEADLTLVCSERERSIILAKAPKLREKVITVPNLIDKNNYHAKDHQQKKTILFIGTLDYYPNIVAVDYLCDIFSSYITPKHLEQFDFIIAGRNPSQEMKNKIERSNFTLKENLTHEEVQELFAQTYLHLVPLTHGSGTRLKIVEALLSNGRVLSTPLGREGIESSNIIEAPIESFHDSFVQLIESPTPFDTEEIPLLHKSWDIDTWFKENEQLLRSKLPLNDA